MVKRIVFATFVGAAIYFFYGMLAWTVLPFHAKHINQFSDEQAVVTAITQAAPESGVYVSPKFGVPPAADASQAKSLVFMSVNHEVRAKGMKRQLMLAVDNALIGAFLISLLMLFAARTVYWCRVSFVILVGAAIGIVGHFPLYIWWGFDFHFVLANILDDIVGWGLAGLVMAAIIKKDEARV